MCQQYMLTLTHSCCNALLHMLHMVVEDNCATSFVCIAKANKYALLCGWQGYACGVRCCSASLGSIMLSLQAFSSALWPHASSASDGL
jgi:hypothetical protein